MSVGWISMEYARKSAIIMLGLLGIALLMPPQTRLQASPLTLPPSKDALIDSGVLNYNSGADGRLDIGAQNGPEDRVLVQFDLPPELSGATIASATLGLYYVAPWSSGNPAGALLRACRVTHSWSEGTGGNPRTQDGVTWTEYNYLDGPATNANNWATPGGDYVLTDSATTIWPTTGGWVTFEVTKIAQGWASGTYPNYGFLIKLDDESAAYQGGVFGSREVYGGWAPAPKLEVTADLNPPATVSDYDGKWKTQSFLISLSASDDASGVAETYYRINDGPTRKVSADGQPSITTEGANNKLEYWSTDKTVKEELPHKVLTGIKLDKTPPSITLTASLVNGSEIKSSTCPVSWTSTDTGSGIDHHEVKLDNGAWTEIGTASTYTFTGLGDGRHELSIKAVDKAGTSRILLLSIITNTNPPWRSEYIILTGVAVCAIVAGLLVNKLRKKAKKPSAPGRTF